MAIIPKFFLGDIDQGNVFYDILEKKKKNFYVIKRRSSKSRKIGISLKGLTHGFGPNMATFPSFFLGNIDQENVFYDILERKNAFLRYKNKSSKRRKIEIFPKGSTHGFSSKMDILQTLFF